MAWRLRWVEERETPGTAVVLAGPALALVLWSVMMSMAGALVPSARLSRRRQPTR